MDNSKVEKTIWHEKCLTKKNIINTDSYKWIKQLGKKTKKKNFFFK